MPETSRFIPLSFTRRSEEEMLQRARMFATLLCQRRSVRAFSPEPIPMNVIRSCLQTAGCAPSGANKQPWHFVVITDPATKKRIREAAENEEEAFYTRRAPRTWLEDLAPLGTGPEKPFLTEAPCLIAIFAQRYRVDAQGTKHKHYYVSESVGIATGMLITALHYSGLACLTHTPSPMRFLNEILQRPSYEHPFLLLVVGYPAPGATVPDIRRKRLEEFVTFMEPPESS